MPETRAKILEAAIELATEEGIMAMTLDGVCKRVAISKGGLIHHFRSKDELLVAMLERFIGHFEKQIAAIESQDSRTSHRRIRAMLTIGRSLVSGTVGDAGLPVPAKHATRLMLALLTASANNPQLLRSIRVHFDQMRLDMMADSQPDSHLAIVLWMAFDGFMLWQHLGLLPDENQPGIELIDRMLALVNDRPSRTQVKKAASKKAVDRSPSISKKSVATKPTKKRDARS
jgi:AcrR family transcriptional regulator